MDRNTFTGLFLILIVMAGSFYFMRPSEAEILKEKERITADSLQKVNGNKPVKAAPVVQKTVDTIKPTGPFANHLTGSESISVVENEKLKLSFTNKGGRIKSVQVKGEETYSGNPLILFDGNTNKFGFQLNIGGKVINTNDLYFTSTPTESGVSLKAEYGPNQFIEFYYTLLKNSNNVDFKVSLNGMNGLIQGNQITFDWASTLLQQEKNVKKEQEHSAPYFKYVEENPDHLSTMSDEKIELNEGKVEWLSFKQHFFSSIIIPQIPFESGSIEVKTSIAPGQVKHYDAKMLMPFNQLANQQYDFKLYFGNNKFSDLKAQGHSIEKQIDLGYWPLKYINRFIVLPVFNFLDSFNWNYGLIILVLTILLKVAMSPLTYKSYISMAKMRILKPEMDEIKAKVGEDNPTLLQQEYLKLYKQVGVNPLGGCLPMLLQLPFVMAFFFFFPNLFEIRGESFLWMKDLSTYDDFIKFGFEIPFIGDHISLMCLLMTISTLIYTYFNNQISGATGQMKYIGYIMPIIFLGVLNSYPSGLNYYYFLANMLTFLQQYLIRRMVNDDKIHAILQENKTKPKTEKKKSKFQARLDEYMRMQQQQQSQMKKK
ncbi:MAG: membrane protein insertase YidC [Pedobacter sp.]|nr:MAG: membrane protein insertase YidC [Pedobacter sp.]